MAISSPSSKLPKTFSKKMEKIAVAALKHLKAFDILVLDVKHLTGITDTMIIASGTSNRHVSSLADIAIEKLKAEKFQPISVSGQNSGEWILIDMADVMIHIMQQRTRDFYQLEKLWNIPKNKIPETQENKILKKSKNTTSRSFSVKKSSENISSPSKLSQDTFDEDEYNDKS